MSEEHIQTVVIDLPTEKQSKDKTDAEKKPDSSDEYDGYETNPELPTSWLS